MDTVTLDRSERDLLAEAARYTAEHACGDDPAGDLARDELLALARRLQPVTAPLPEGSTYTRGAR